MNFDWIELAIIAFIAGGIGLAVWRGGQANPEGTGALGKTVTTLSAKMTRLETRVGHVESELQQLQETGASAKDIERIEERIQTVRAEMHGHHQLSAATNASVQRIERVLIEKAIKGGAGG